MSETQTTSGFADINGTRLYYEVAGDGQPLVLTHAGIADSRMWDDQFNAFAQHYRVIRYDLRGFGQTEPVDGPFAHRHDLHGLLRFLNVERAHLLGCSRGGSICMDFTLEHPEMVSALVMVCSSPGGMSYEGELPPIIQELIAADQAGDIERMNDLEVRLWVDGLYRSPEQVSPAIRERVREMNGIVLRNETLGKGTEESLDPPAAARLSAIKVPTLVIVGDLDVPVTQHAARLMTEQIPDSRTEVIAGTAHLPNMERPDEFNRIVLEFYQAHA